MKKCLFCFLILISNFTVFSQTSLNVSGTIVSDQTWNVDTVKVTGDLLINPNVTLTIKPGTIIQFLTHNWLNVSPTARILAIGTANDSIIFTALNPVTGWCGLRFFHLTPEQPTDSSIISFCRFEYGKANLGNIDHGDRGGAILLFNKSTIRVSNCNFLNNYASRSGGAIFVGFCAPNIVNNRFANNSAKNYGGAFYCYKSSARFINNLVIKNSTTLNGGGVCISVASPDRSQPIIMNNTIGNNHSNSDGGGIICQGTAPVYPVLRNNIIWGNTSGTTAAQIAGAFDTIISCNIEGGFSGTVKYSRGNINENPLFVDTTKNNWSLTQASSCINIIDPNADGISNLIPATDNAGNARITMNLMDIGAFEYYNSAPSVIFLANGGDGSMEPQIFTENGTQNLSSINFFRTGYTFSGWATTEMGPAEYADQATFTIGSSDVSLYAQWTVNSNNMVVFYPNGGIGSMAPQVIEIGTTSNLNVNTFTRLGHTFQGWSTTAEGSVEYLDQAIFTKGPNSENLFAQWLPNSYSVIFVSNGGVGTMTPQTFTYGTNGRFTANEFTRTGYTFTGWSTSPNGAVEYADQADYSIGVGNTTLYAQWVPMIHTISFNGNGGIGTMSGQSVQTSTTVQLSPINFTRAGYSFSGWSLTPSGTIAYADQGNYTMGNEDVTLYAQWTAVTHVLTVLTNGNGTVSPTSGTYPEGSIVEITATPGIGSFIDHWSGDVSAGQVSSISLTMNTNKTVTVYFAQNQGSGNDIASLNVQQNATVQGDLLVSGNVTVQGVLSDNRIQIKTVPFTISQSGHYYLTQSLNASIDGQPSIQISANNVVVDLNGFTLSGPGKDSPHVISGIVLADGYSNIEIKNGTISDFPRDGISSLNNIAQVKLHNLVIARCGASGIIIPGECVIENCISNNNNGNGIQVGGGQIFNNKCFENAGIGLAVQNAGIIKNNISNNNGSNGFEVGNNCIVVENNAHHNNSSGFAVNGHCYLKGNSAFANSIYGYNFNLEGNSLFTDNVAFENATGSLSACPACTFGTNLTP
jgi:uncharacterized repeat protein (TIGR02543 family)